MRFEHINPIEHRKAQLRLLAILVDESSKTGHSLVTLILELMQAHNEYSRPYLQTVPNIDSKNIIKSITKKLVMESFKKNNGNQRATAKELGIAKSTLHDWLKEWNVNPKLLLELK